MKIYLAGNMVTDWRKKITETVAGAEFIEPARGDKWFERQCQQMNEADICFALIDTEARHIGTISELSAFRVMGKPRILVIAQDRRGDRGYVIAEKLASPGMVTESLEQGVSWLRDLAGVVT